MNAHRLTLPLTALTLTAVAAFSAPALRGQQTETPELRAGAALPEAPPVSGQPESGSSSALPLSFGVVAPAAVSPVPINPGAITPGAARPRPRQPRLGLIDWAGLGAVATLRVLDYTTTEKALEYPQYCHEAQLPQALVESKPGFAAFQAATVAVNYFAYRALVRRNLRPLARAAQAAYTGIMTAQIVSNYHTLGAIPGY